MSGYGEARPIGRMVPLQPTQAALPDAWCPRCNAKLSQYRSWGSDTHCAPCQRALKPPDKPAPEESVPPIRFAESTAMTALRNAVGEKPAPRSLTMAEKAANRKYQLCDCGRDYHRKYSAMCRQCRSEVPTSNPPGSLNSRICKCGGPKKNGREMCRDCRFPNRGVLPCCAECGGPKSHIGALCWDCRYPNRAA